MSILKEWQTMKVEIVSYTDKYSKYFYDLNHDWLSEFFYVEEYDEKVLKNCKEEIIDKGGYIFFALHKTEVVGTMALIPRENNVCLLYTSPSPRD